ncbi:MAG: glycerol-3-phosphate dehydrogenase [Acidobacteriota bacterium]
MIIAEPTFSEATFDVIVIGAGINGAGIARDAAMRGLKVLLLDKGDIGSGTSSWSTRLIHGGLRYLEHGEFGLVRESLRERKCLLNIAPHLVRPLPLLVPVYKGSRRGPWTVRAGMFFYDLLSFDKTLPSHRLLSRDETLQEAAALEPEGLLGGVLYYDAQVEYAERLVLENALSAVAHGAEVVTYARVDHLIVEDGRVAGVEFRSELTGGNYVACATVVVNAAGPWVDELPGKGSDGSERLIGGTKGSHIIVGAFPGSPVGAIYVEAQTDQRPFFIIPWNGNYLIGTTDIRYDGDLDNLQIEGHEIDYLLRETNRVIPGANLDRSKILFTYAGVRPLPFTGDKDEQSITRRHFIRPHPSIENLLSIVGGKLTTYRSLAEETVDLLFKKLGQDSPKCTTHQVSLPGGDTTHFETFQANFRRQHGLPTATCDHLLRTYGVAAAAVMELVSQDSRLAEIFDPETGAIAAEVVHAFKNELAQTLADCLLRRTMVGLNSTCGLNAIEATGRILQEHLGWPEEFIEAEIAAYRKHVERFRLLQSVKGAQ